MPRVRLTKSVIDSLQTRQVDTVYWDEGLPGFGIKVTPKGKKVFLVLYRVAGAGSRLRKYTIGPYGRVTLLRFDFVCGFAHRSLSPLSQNAIGCNEV